MQTLNKLVTRLTDEFVPLYTLMIHYSNKGISNVAYVNLKSIRSKYLFTQNMHEYEINLCTFFQLALLLNNN